MFEIHPSQRSEKQIPEWGLPGVEDVPTPWILCLSYLEGHSSHVPNNPASADRSEGIVD